MIKIPHICVSSEFNKQKYNVIVKQQNAFLQSPKSIASVYEQDYILTSNYWNPKLNKLVNDTNRDILDIINPILYKWEKSSSSLTNRTRILFTELEQNNIIFITEPIFYHNTFVNDKILTDAIEEKTTEIEKILEDPILTIQDNYSTCRNKKFIIQESNKSNNIYVYDIHDIYKSIEQMKSNPKYNIMYNIIKKKFGTTIYPCREYYIIGRHIWEFITLDNILIQIYINLANNGWIIEEYNPVKDQIIIHKV